jgi:2',3'-cyclic-nucleotide 2'-phosphodiesterase (5'-nucleotidase family)
MVWRAWRRRLRFGLTAFFVMAGTLVVAGLVLHHTLGRHHATGRFTILQINDVYKVEGIERETVGGLARVRALRRSLEKEGWPVLMLHAGDFLFPSVMSKFLQARPMVRCLNLMDGDEKAFDDHLVVTFGNHEFDDKSPDLLQARILDSDFRWVTSSILFRKGEGGLAQPPSQRFKNVSEDLVVDLAGIRVGILGVTVPGEDRPWVDYRYGSRSRLVREALARLGDQGAQVLIALTHQDFEEDIRLAEEFPELDLIVGGHDHTSFQERVGHTWITKADADAKSAIRIDVAVLEDGSVLAAPEKIDLGAKAPKDHAMQAAVQQAREELGQVYEKEKGKKLTTAFATTEELLEGVEPAVRGRETALGNLLADSIRERMKTRVAFVNGGAIRINDNIPQKGSITLEDLEGIFYFDNNLVSFNLTRAELLRILRTSISQVERGSGRFLQVSCIRFRYRLDHSADPPIHQVDLEDVWICPEGNPHAPASEWLPLAEAPEPISVGTIEYLWKNGYKEGYELFAAGKGGKSPGLTSPKDPIDWRKEFEKTLQGKVVKPQVEGRIQRVEG